MYSDCHFTPNKMVDVTRSQLMGLGYALATATLFQSFIKILVGGLRPHFLSICAPTIPPAALGKYTPGPNNRMWYTASQVCTGDSDNINEAQMSFPSGHACAAFARFGFLALYLNAKFKVFGHARRSGYPYGGEGALNEERISSGRHPGRIQHWKVVVFVTPWLIAFLIAGSKVRDGWHHPVDVIFGAIVGTAFAHMAFRMVYRGIYDSRVNHLPMEQ